jgi:superfamily II DNA or RNA helicase
MPVKKSKRMPAKTPKNRKPEGMSLEEWQIALRREYGRDQEFQVANVGEEPFFSEFAVTNPQSGRTYRVAVRGLEPGVNYCSCPDFAVNALGTCKHVEWLLHKLQGKRGAKTAFKKGHKPSYSEVYVEYGARRRVRFRAGPSCPPTVLALAGRHFDHEGYLREDTVGDFEDFVRAARESGPDVRVYEDTLSLVARLRDDQNRRKAVEKQFGGAKSRERMARLLKTTLYPYQREGALFAAKAGRCLLADDMGLGKTVQAIAAVEILAQTAGVERVLVVCPTALKYQWQQEAVRFAERTAGVIEGNRVARMAQYADETFYKIASYDSVHRDQDLIARWQPDVVILDEAQRIKNWETRRAKSVKQIDSPYAIVLTGTPLENRLGELHSIMEFVDRHHLGPLYRFLHEHQHVDANGKVIGYRNLDKIKESLGAVLLRRRKKEVLQQLPERTDKHLFVEMTDAQWGIHESAREEVARIVAKWRRRGFLTEEEQRKLMIELQLMRMSCNSTYLVDKETDQGPKPDECLLLLDDLLEDTGNKVVVFSQWLGTHELIIRRLEAAGHGHAYYHGSLDGKARKMALDRFKSDPRCRVLLCTESGGVGLNLQHASVVINMDQPWNPAVLEQRIGRVHRLGQHRHVQVYHFISQGTIEHGMLDVLKFKTSMFEGVLDGGESEVFLGGTKMKKFMETVESVSDHIPPAASTPGAEDMAKEADAVATGDDDTRPEAAPVQAGAEAWGALLSAGSRLLADLGRSLQEGRDEEPGAQFPLSGLVQTNRETGVPELRIPLPDPDTAGKIASALNAFASLLAPATQQRK